MPSYGVRTTVGQERSVADQLSQKAKKRKGGIYSILSPAEVRGYLFVEARNDGLVEDLISSIRHAKGVLEGEVEFSELEHYIESEPSVTGIERGDVVELISGPFKREEARVKRVDENKDEVVVELIESMVPTPVTVKGDHVKLISKEGNE